jgi:hypothetical protein
MKTPNWWEGKRYWYGRNGSGLHIFGITISRGLINSSQDWILGIDFLVWYFHFVLLRDKQ